MAKTSSVHGRPAGHPLDAQISMLLRAADQKDPKEAYSALLQALCELARATTEACGVAVIFKPNNFSGRVSAQAIAPAADPADPTPAWYKELATVCARSSAISGPPVVLNQSPARSGVFEILQQVKEGHLVLAANVPSGGRGGRLSDVADLLYLLRWLFIFTLQRSNTGAASAAAAGDDAPLRQAVDILERTQTAGRFAEAAAMLCAELASRFACLRVALGEMRGRMVRVVAVDQMEKFDRHTRSMRQLAEVMQEAYDQDRMVLHPEPSPVPSTSPPSEPPSPSTPVGTGADVKPGLTDSGTGPGLVGGSADGALGEAEAAVEAGAEGAVAVDATGARAARDYARDNRAGTVLTLPLRDPGGVHFILTLAFAEAQLPPARLDQICLLGRLAAPRLADLRRAEAFPTTRAWRWFLRSSADLFGPRRTMLKLSTLILAATAFALWKIPGDLTVRAPLVVAGERSYTQTAPMDGFLAEVAVHPGDRVEAGALLGRLDDTEVVLEIAALKAQQEIHVNQRAQCIQEGRDAEAEIARLEAEKTAANLAWAERRREMAELRADVSGFLVSEDLGPRLGQPVRHGQDLFEITDTESLRLLLRVDESDIDDLATLAAAAPAVGEFTLTAYPDRPLPFTVERIHPYAEAAGGTNGFEVRARIDGGEALLFLRPGMEGHARITTGEAPLLWVWSRKVVNRVRLLAWRWL